ncbi:hypothetical protein [Isoptericola sp. NPDC056605]|uniref:hypothetical protein n=1 Tax=Isoptericola sp. NPDC056605 TaxID=3345876 RepID=UPI0036B843C4
MTTFINLLDPQRIYLAHDRWVCGETHCAGMTAATTGHTTSGAKVRPVTADDVEGWEWAGLGPLGCECGRLTARRGDLGEVVVTTKGDAS